MMRETDQSVIDCESREHELRRSSDFHAVLFAMASHDLRQQLQVIMWSYEWLSRSLTIGPERELIDCGRRASAEMAERLAFLTEALRMHQKTGCVGLSPVPLGPLFDRLLAENSQWASQREIEFRVVRTRAVVVSDKLLLEGALRNIIQNALKFTPPHGRVLLGCRRRGAVVRIEVHDTGIGIPPGRLLRIFDAFQRLDPAYDGLGLGLFVVSRAVELLKHHLEVRSTVGRGTCFSILADQAFRDALAPDWRDQTVIGDGAVKGQSKSWAVV